MSKLVKCPDCGHQVSRSAASCPSCGRKRPGGVNASYAAAQILVVFFGALVMMSWMHHMATRPGPLESQFSELDAAAENSRKVFGIEEP